MHFMWYLPAFLLLVTEIVLPVSGDCRPDDRFNKFGRKACRKAFCFDVTLTVVATGPFEQVVVTAGDALLDHYAQAGFSESAVIAEGRDAVAFFQAKYGLDFTGLQDDDLLRGVHPDTGNNANLCPFVLDTDETFRVYQAATRCGFDFLNVPIQEAGWKVDIINEIPAGVFPEIIPAGAFLEFGSFVIDICGDHPDRFCPSILRSDRSRDPLFMRVSSRTYLSPTPPPANAPFLPNSCDVHSAEFGDGIIRGIYFPAGTRLDGRAVVDGKLVMTFPATRPFPP